MVSGNRIITYREGTRRLLGGGIFRPPRSCWSGGSFPPCRTGRSSRKLAMRLDGKREPDYHVQRRDAAAAWRRHFQPAAFLLERGIVPAVPDGAKQPQTRHE